MAQVINTNIASLNAQRNLNSSQSSLNTSLERLSTGLRINSAKDDAAGLAISSRFTTQINGLNQAVRNANDGISLAQTAEGALGASGDSLQRIRQLALQAANSTNSASDRAALNSEVQQLLAEVDRVGQSTQFNGTNILDGSFSSAQFQVGANANQTITFSVTGATTNTLGTYQATSNVVTSSAFDGDGFSVNGTEVGVSVATSAAGVTASSAAAKATAINSVSNETGVTASASTSLSGSAPTANRSIDNGALLVNGVAVGSVAANANAVTQGRSARDAINAVSVQTGVVATADASTGALSLTASDGRDITLTTNGTDATTRIAAAQAIKEATGLNLSDGAVTATATAETATLTFAADNVGSANGITDGDTIDIGGQTFEFTVGGSTASGSNIAVAVTAGQAGSTAADALRTAINAAGLANGVAAGGTGTTVDLTSTQAGANTILASGAIAETGRTAGVANAAVVTEATAGANAVAEQQSITFTGAVTDGDTVVIDGTTYEFDVDGGGLSGGGNTAVNVTTGSLANTDAAAALAAAITGGVSGSDAGAVVTVTSATPGAAGFADITATVSNGATIDTAVTAGADIVAEITTVTLSQLANEGVSRGDVITVAGTNFEFVQSGDAAAAGNVAVTLTSTGTDAAKAQANASALEVAINGSAVNGTVTASTSGSVVSITANVAGTAGAFTATETLAAASAVGAVTYAATAGLNGAQADDADGVTTRGTLTLSSASSFTLGGADLAFAGLDTANPSLSTLASVDISSVQGANDAIAILDGALSQVNSIRADLGAIQTRFESTISNLSTTAENLSSARSRILDADFAAETANLTRSTILQQAGISILSQANALPQQVLSLLQ